MSLLSIISYLSLVLAFFSTIIVLWDVSKNPQTIKIMNLVWPITTLYLGLIGLWAYWKMGRNTHHHRHHLEHHVHNGNQPSWRSVFLSTTHCGSGCVVGDILGEAFVFGIGLTIFGSMLIASFVADFLLAYLFGIAFQYFAIMPMKELNKREGIKKALQADTWSLIAFEIGMFVWMGISHVVFHIMNPLDPVYWFMMQIALTLGFITSYPANWYLIKGAIKHAM